MRASATSDANARDSGRNPSGQSGAPRFAAEGLQSVLGNRALQRLLGTPLRRSCGCGGDEASGCACPDVEGTVRKGLATSSRPLDAPLQREMEQSFGRSFSGVRLHTDAPAAASAEKVNARAYTVGSHIVFGAGAFAPHTADGRHTLAHELTHVAQQGDNVPIPTRLGRQDDPAEHAAENVAHGLGHRHETDADSGALRRTKASLVSCAKTPWVIPTENAVDAITDAEKLGMKWMDDGIAVLEGAIAAGAGSEDVNSALRFIGINPDKPSTWTDKGIGTAKLALRRMKIVRNIVGTNTVFYTCRAHNKGDSGGFCKPGWFAFSFKGRYHIYLCGQFWKHDLIGRAQTIVHESFHISLQWDDVGHEGNAHCWERFVQKLIGEPEKQYTDKCKEPA